MYIELKVVFRPYKEIICNICLLSMQSSQATMNHNLNSTHWWHDRINLLIWDRILPLPLWHDRINLLIWDRILPLREKCPNTEFFLVRIFTHSDWIRRDIQSECGKIRTRKDSVFGQFLRSILAILTMNDRARYKVKWAPRWYYQVSPFAWD